MSDEKLRRRCVFADMTCVSNVSGAIPDSPSASMTRDAAALIS